MTPSREHKSVKVARACEELPVTLLEEFTRHANDRLLRTGDLIPIIDARTDYKRRIEPELPKVIGFAKN